MKKNPPKYYQHFVDAKSRCRNPNNKSYVHIGRRDTLEEAIELWQKQSQ